MAGTKGFCLVGLTIMSIMAVPALGAYITDISMVTNPKYIYKIPVGQTPGKFQLENTSGSTNVTISLVHMRVNEVWGYDIVGTARYNLSGSNLLSDNSTSGGKALGHFDDGATLTISGSIKNLDTQQTIFTGTILTATVSDEFDMYEDEPLNPNWMHAHQQFTVTGGALSTGEAEGLRIMDFVAHYSFMLCTVEGATNVLNLQQGNIKASLGNGSIQIAAPVPEPGMLGLLMFSGIVGLRKHRVF
jgi:hypothetical protein